MSNITADAEPARKKERKAKPRLTDAGFRNWRLPALDKKGRPLKQDTYMYTIDEVGTTVGVVCVAWSVGGPTIRFYAGAYDDQIDKRGEKVRRLTTLKLGTYPQMSIEDAKAAARKFWIDKKRQVQQPEVKQEGPKLFDNVADDWFKRYVEENQLRSAKEIRRQLDKYVYPSWEGRPFVEIRRGDVNRLLDHIKDHHGPAQSDAVFGTIRSMMQWYQIEEENYVYPLVAGMRRSKAISRCRIFNDGEIRALWCVQSTFGALLKMLLLTAQRREKVATMRWHDLEDGVWTIHNEHHREKATAGQLKLPALALDIIAAQPRILGNPFVFGGRGSGPFASFTQYKGKLDQKYSDWDPWVIHDLRRTARSLMSRAGVFPHIAERVLGHTISGVEGIYDRHGYDAEKADALNKLAALVESIVNPTSDNVTSFQEKRAQMRELGSPG